MALEFSCNRCNSKLKVADDQAGKKVKCGSCSHFVLVPTAVQMSSIQPVNAAGKKPAAKAEAGISLDLDLPDDDQALQTPASATQVPKTRPAATANSEPNPYELAGDEDFKPAGKNDVKRALTVLDGEDDFSFELDADVPNASLANKPAPNAPTSPTSTAKSPASAPSKSALDADEKPTLTEKKSKPAAKEPAGGGYDLADDDNSATAPVSPGTPKPLSGRGSDKAVGKSPGLEKPGKPDKSETPAAPAQIVGAPPPGSAVPAAATGIAGLPAPVVYGGAGVVAVLLLVIGLVLLSDSGSTTTDGSLPASKDARAVTSTTTNSTNLPVRDAASTPITDRMIPPPPPDAASSAELIAKVKKLREVGADEQAAWTVYEEFWKRYDATVEANTAAKWKEHFQWCKSKGLRAAAEDARRAGLLLAPNDAELRDGTTKVVALPNGKTVSSTKEALGAIDRLPGKLLVTNRAYAKVKLEIADEGLAVEIRQGYQEQITVKKPGVVKFKVSTPDGKSADFTEYLVPGTGKHLALLNYDELPRLPFGTLEATQRLGRLVQAGPLTPALPPGLGDNRLLEFKTVADGVTLKLAGVLPDRYADNKQLGGRLSVREPLPVRIGKADPGRTIQIIVGAEQNPSVAPIYFSVQVLGSGQIVGGEITTKNILYTPTIDGTPFYDRAGHFINGTVQVTGFPVQHALLCQAMNLDPVEVASLVERKRLKTLPQIQALSSSPGTDLIDQVTKRPEPIWDLQSFLSLCAYLGVTPQGITQYRVGPLGPYATSAWMGTPLLEVLTAEPNADTISSLARHTAQPQVRPELMRQMSTTNSYGRPFACLALAWPGNDDAVGPLAKLANEYVQVQGTGGSRGTGDTFLDALIRNWSESMNVPASVTNALLNIGTDSAVAELKKMAVSEALGVEFRKAAVRALSRMGHPEAVAFMSELIRNNRKHEMFSEALLWLGRWDLQKTRGVVLDKLARAKAGSQVDLLDLAQAVAAQTHGEGNLFALKQLAEFDPRPAKLQVLRADTRVGSQQEWQIKVETLPPGRDPVEHTKSVCWLLGHRGDLVAAGLMRRFLDAEWRELDNPQKIQYKPLDLFRLSLPPRAKDIPERLFPTLKPGELWNPIRHSQFKNALTIYEESFGGFAGDEFILLVHPLITLVSENAKLEPVKPEGDEPGPQTKAASKADPKKESEEELLDPRVALEETFFQRGLQAWAFKLLADRGANSARVRELTRLLYRIPESQDVLEVEPPVRPIAGLGLLRLGDKDSLAAIANADGEEDGPYRKIFEPLKLNFFRENKIAGASPTAISGGKASQLFEDKATGLNTTPNSRLWEDYVNSRMWSAISGLFDAEVVPGDLYPEYSLTQVDAEFQKLVTRLRDRYSRAAASGAATPPPMLEVRAGPARLRPGVDREMALKLLDRLVWPYDGSGDTASLVEWGAEYRTLQHRALANLLSLRAGEQKPEVLKKLLVNFDRPILSGPSMEAVAALSGPDSTVLMAALTRRSWVDPITDYDQITTRYRLREQKLNQEVNTLLKDVVDKQGFRLVLADVLPLVRVLNRDLELMVMMEPTYQAIRTMGRLQTEESLNRLLQILEAREKLPEDRKLADEYSALQKARNQLFRRSVAALALADAATARPSKSPQANAWAAQVRPRVLEALHRIVTTTPPDGFGFKWVRTPRVKSTSNDDTGAVAVTRLELIAEFKLNVLAALAQTAGPESADAVALAMSYSSASDPDRPVQGQFTELDRLEKQLNLEALRTLLTIAGPESVPMIISAMTDLAERLDLARGGSSSPAMPQLVMRIASMRCLNPRSAPLLLRLLGNDKADAAYRRWALSSLVLAAREDSDFQALANVAVDADFRRVLVAAGSGDPFLELVNVVRGADSGLTAKEAAEFLRRLLQAAALKAPADPKEPGSLLNKEAEVQALLALRDNPDPAAGEALIALRRIPRYAMVSAMLGYARGDRHGLAARDLTGISFLGGLASQVGGDTNARQRAAEAIDALSDMFHPESLSALLDFVEAGIRSKDNANAVKAAGGFYRVALMLTDPHTHHPAVPERISERLAEKFTRREVPNDLQIPLSIGLAALGHDIGLAFLASRLVETPSGQASDPLKNPFDFSHALTLLDVIAARKANASPTPGLVGLAESLLIKRKQPNHLSDQLVAAAAELAASGDVFAGRDTRPDSAERKDIFYLAEVNKTRGLRVVIWQALALSGRTPAVRAKARAELDALRAAKGALKTSKEELNELELAIRRYDSLEKN